MAPSAETILGSVAPDFEVEVVDSNGSISTVSLASLRPAGKVLLIDFFAPWCKTCPAKAKELDQLAKGEHGQSCTFVLVCVDGGLDGARAFAAEHGVEKCIITSVVDEDAPSDLFMVKGLPHC